MDQTQHLTKIEAHPYHGAAHVSLDRPKPMYDPQCPLCREELAEARRQREAEKRDPAMCLDDDFDDLLAHPEFEDD